MKKIACLSALACAAALLATTKAEAAASTLVLSGADFSSTSDYQSVGIIGALGGSLDQSGAIYRLWADHLTYNYPSNGAKVDARSWGASASLGYHLIVPGGGITAYAGVDTRDTTLPAGVTSSIQGQKTGARFELDANHDLMDGVNLNGIGSYVTGTEDYWTRAQLLVKVASSLSIGPEIVMQGNPNYSGYRLGGALAGTSIGPVGLSFDGGFQEIAHRAGVYGGGSALLSF